MIAQIISTIFSIFPSWFAISILGFFVVLATIIVIKIVSAILDAIPFL